MTLPKIPEARTLEQRLSLPWPPSLNNLFLNVTGRGRVLTKEYTAWRTEAGWTLKAQHPVKHKGPVTIAIELNPPTRRAFDLDGKIKAPLDLLVQHEVVPDDSMTWVRSVNVKTVEVGAPCTIIVRAI